MKLISVIIILTTICSCSTKYEKFDSYFQENKDDTIQIYCIDSFELPDSIKPITDNMFRGTEIDIDLIRALNLDSCYDRLFPNSTADYFEGKKFFGVFKYKITNDYLGYVVRVSHTTVNPPEAIVEYVYNLKENQFDTTVLFAHLWRALSADNDINSWIIDINKDGNKDILTKSSFFDYGSMDDLDSNNKELSNTSIIESCRYDTAWCNLWTKNGYISKPTRFDEIATCFNYKMLEYYNGYRRSYWFE
jgi:hypothetical protein